MRNLLITIFLFFLSLNLFAQPSVGAISVSGATGAGGAFIVGNTVTAQWDNGIDGATTITAVTFDFSEFGGGSAVVASDIGAGVYEASYMIATPGSTETTTADVSVTVVATTGGGTTQDDEDHIVDDILPTATVTIDSDPIFQGDLAQVVTVTYDEAMNPATNPAITFSSSVNFTTAGDGAWTVGNTVWTETFNHDGTAEEIGAETADVASTSGATDAAGNADIGDSSPNFEIDTQSPTATVTIDSDPIFPGDLVQVVTVTYDEPMNPATSPAITFSSSVNFTTAGDGAWTVGNTVWTETFNHDGTSEQSFTETADVASTSGATDVAGNADIGDSSPAFVLDTQAPTATVTVDSDPIYQSDLVQVVTVTYDEPMNPGTNPTITFSSSVNFTTAGDGAWTVGNTVWTETFNHDGTAEEIGAETADVASASGATDVVGIADIGDSSPAFVIDTQSPTATVTIDSDPIFQGDLAQVVTVTYDEAMNPATNPAITFSSSVNFTTAGDGAWTVGNTVWTETFNHDGTAEEIGAETADVASTSGATDAAGNADIGDSSPNFEIDTQSPTATVTIDSDPIFPGDLVQVVTVTYDEPMNPATSPAITFSSSANFTTAGDGAWTVGNTVWTETFNHDGTSEQSFTETADVASTSGATDVAGNADIGDSSPAFVLDTQAPTATVTVDSDPIYQSDLVQVVTVTYDEPMNPGTNPTITFSSSVNFTTAGDGAWTVGNTVWTETFNHDGTAEEIGAETADVASASGATDVVGIADIGDSSPAFVIDTQSPSFVDATFYDTNSDGSIDEILIEFSEDVDEASVNDLDFNIGSAGYGAVPFGVVATPASNGIDLNDTDNYITLSVNTGTTASQTIEYTQGGLSDESGNLAATNLAITTIDLAPPVIISAVTSDLGGVAGEIDQITVTLSEDIDGLTLDTDGGSDDFIVTDGAYMYTVSLVAPNGANGAIVSLTERGSPDTGVTPDINLGIGDIEDLAPANNALTIAQDFTGTQDGAAPVIYSSFLQSSNAFLQVVFSEDIERPGGGNIVLGDFDQLVTLTSAPNPTTLNFSNITTLAGDPVGVSEDTILFIVNIDPSFGVYGGDDDLGISTNGSTIEDASGLVLQAAETAGPYTVLDLTNFPQFVSASYTPLTANSGYIELVFTEGLFRDASTNRSPMLANSRNDGDINNGEWTNGSSDCDGDELCLTYTRNGGAVINDDNNSDISWRRDTGAGLANNVDYSSDTYRIYFLDLPNGQFRGVETYRFGARNGTQIRGRTTDAYMPAVADYFFDFNLPDAFAEDFDDVISAEAHDVNADGNIDEIVITFPDDIDDATLAASLADFSIIGGVNNGVSPSSLVTTSLNGVDPNVADDNIFTLGFTSYVGTAVDGDLDFAGTLTFSDDAGNLILAGDFTPSDEAGPVILSALTEDTEATPDGLIDQITITFSENLANIYGNQTFFSVDEGGDNYPVVSATPGAGDEIILAITEGSYSGGPAGPLDTHITPDITITAGFGDDTEGALTPAQTFTNTSDGAAPYSTVDVLATPDASPDLTGTVDDPTALVLVNVSTFTKTATNNGDGTWTFTNSGSAPSGFTLGALGNYEVTAICIDQSSNNNTASDVTNNELTINGGANITPATPADICTSDGFVSLGQIEIDEGSDGDFASSGTILLTLPEGFEFDTSIPANFAASSLSDISVISGTYIGTASFRLNITITGTAGDDIVRIDDLEVKATLGGQSGVVLERAGGTASLLTTDTDYAVLTSLNAPTPIASLDETISGVTNISELTILSGTNFSLDGTDQSPTTLNWYENVVDGSPEFTGTVATQADLNVSTGLHSYFLRDDDGICESNSTIFNLLVYTYTDNGTNNFSSRTFRSTDDPDTMVFSNPANHTVSVSGSGIVANISEAGTLKAVFDPSTVAEGTYNITYQVTNAVGETQSIVGSFTVEALSDLIQEFRLNGIADASPDEDYCEVDILSFDADLAEVSSLASAYFFRFSYFKIAGPGPYSLSPVAFDPVVGSNYPADPNQNNGSAPPNPYPLGGHNPNANWDLDLSTLTPGASYDIYLEYNRIGDGARGQRRVFSLNIQSLPVVDIAAFGNQCENDNTIYQLDARVDGITGPMTNGYELEFFNGVSWVPEYSATDEDINPFDLQISQGGSGPGQYRIIFESTPQGDASCVNSDTLAFTLFPTPGEPILNASHNISWKGAPWTDTGDVVNGFNSYVMEYCSTSDINFIVGENSGIRYNWYDDSFNLLQANQWFISAAAAFDDPTTGGVTEVPTAGTTREIYFGTFVNGCESPLKKITIYIYESTEVPTPTAASLSADGELEAVNHYIYDYCDAYSSIILEAADVSGSNPTSRNPSTYFNLYSEDQVLQTTNFVGTDLTSGVLSLSTGNIDTTIYVAQVWNDQTPGGAGTASLPFEGCQSALVRFDINVTGTPAQPLASDFIGINSTIIHICQNDAIGNISTSDADDAEVDEYVWYDNDGSGGIGAEMVRRINGGSISQAAIEANSSFDPAVVGQYSFFVTKVSGLNSATSFSGCETAATEFIIEVHPIDDTDFPIIASTDYTDIGDGEYDLDTDADHLFPVCITELNPASTLNVTSLYGGTKEFVWYKSNSSFSTQTEHITSTNPTFDQLDMGIGDITGATSRFFIVTQRLDPDDFPAGQGCESGLATTYVEVQFSDLSALTMTLTNGPDYCWDDTDESYSLLVGGTDVNSLPQPGGGNQSDLAQVRYAVLLNNNLTSDTLDVMGVPVQGAGNITTDFDAWHIAKGGNTPDGSGNIVGGITTTHYILMEYTDPATNCAGNEIFVISIHPDPPASFTVDGIDADQLEFCYDDAGFDVLGFNYETGLGLSQNTGIFSVNTSGLGVTNNNNATFDPSDAHDFGGGNQFSNQSSHQITFTYTDAFGCQRDTVKTVFVNPLPQIVDSEIKSASTCAATDIKLFVEMADNELGQGKDAYNFVWQVNGGQVQDLDGTAGGDTLVYNLGAANSANFSVFVTYIGTGLPGEYTTNCMSSVINQSITVGEAPDPSITWVGVTEGRNTTFRIDENNAGLPNADVNYIEFFVDGVSQYLDDESGITPPPITFPLDINYNPSNPGYAFADAGSYTVRVLMRTSAGCEVDFSRTIEIIDHLSGLNSYTEDFESGAGGWTIETLSLDGKANDLVTSWEIGTNVPDSTSGTTYDGSNAIYTNGYQSSEVSFVYSPSFDLSAFSAPTISFLRYEEFETFRDGVVFQMSTNDGRTWVNVGGFNDLQPAGLKSTPGWYDKEAITSAPGVVSPGSQSSAQNNQGVGWALDRDWDLAIAPLSIPANQEDSVRFRFALAAQATPKTTNGFAFDLVQIYDREQVVLVEQFSSTLSQKSRNINRAVDNAANFNGSDVIRINYFTDFANSGNSLDQLNQRNTSAPGAKSSFYGIEGVPSIAISGQAQLVDNNSQIEADGSIDAQLTNAKLVNPGFDITFPTLSIDADNNLSVAADFTAISDIPGANTKLGLFIAILEPQIILDNSTGAIGFYQVGDTITNVLRKMMPSAAGQFEQGTISENDVLSIEAMTWPISNMLDPDTLTIVAYVQDLTTRQVLQSKVMGLNNNGDLALGLDKLPDFSLYPNPADKQVTVEFADGIGEDADWVIYDQAGREVLKGEIKKGTKTMTVQTTEMPSGLYFIHLYAEDRKRQAKRIMVVH